MRDSHVGHLVEREEMLILKENRKSPRMSFIRSEQANDILAGGSHVTMRASRPGLFCCVLLGSLAGLAAFFPQQRSDLLVFTGKLQGRLAFAFRVYIRAFLK